jgi:hypothetical protein
MSPAKGICAGNKAVQVRHVLLLDKVFEGVTVLVRAVKVTVCAWFESAMSDGVISEQRMGARQ